MLDDALPGQLLTDKLPGSFWCHTEPRGDCVRLRWCTHFLSGYGVAASSLGSAVATCGSTTAPDGVCQSDLVTWVSIDVCLGSVILTAALQDAGIRSHRVNTYQERVFPADRVDGSVMLLCVGITV